jgi:RluA family pseudouridine synthase
MERVGFEQIYQLDGGILKYFEECGNAHYNGECFVFDQRVGLDPTLAETDSDQCYACQSPLTEDDQRDSRYIKGISCPYCFATDEEQRTRSREKHQAAIVAATHPLPGSKPYTNFRPLLIPAAYEGQTLADFLTGVFPQIPREEWDETAANGRLLDRLEQPVTLSQAIRGGERYLHAFPQTSEPDVNPDIRILYEDEALIVIDKPAPLPLHPSGRFNRNTLQYILQQVYEPQKPRPIHRLDANTRGLVVFARTKHFAGLIQPQFANGDVEKIYLARVQGHPPEDRFTCEAPISAAAGEFGSRAIDTEAGLPAKTEFQVLQRFPDGTSLLEVRPLTGRTNQIRVHLWELGWPICGEQSYLPQQQLGATQTHSVEDTPLCLFAKQITFVHPLSRQRMTFQAESPNELRAQ